MPPKTPPAPKYEDPPSDTIPVTGPVSGAANAVQKLSRIPTDKLLVLFVCGGFGFLLWEDKRQGAEQNAAQMRTFEDSREADRKFHESQREKDRTFYGREREADRATLHAVGQKLEAIERAVRARTGDEDVSAAPMPKLKGSGGGGSP
jgi:hypothetical protein